MRFDPRASAKPGDAIAVEQRHFGERFFHARNVTSFSAQSNLEKPLCYQRFLPCKPANAPTQNPEEPFNSIWRPPLRVTYGQSGSVGPAHRPPLYVVGVCLNRIGTVRFNSFLLTSSRARGRSCTPEPPRLFFEQADGFSEPDATKRTAPHGCTAGRFSRDRLSSGVDGQRGAWCGGQPCESAGRGCASVMNENMFDPGRYQETQSTSNSYAL
jgi:hypothetical protein